MYMEDPESTESKEKSNFRFRFFELWLFVGHFCDVITPIFFFFTSKNKNRKNLVFLCIQPIADLSCKFDHF